MLRNYLRLKAIIEPYSAPWCLLASAVHFHDLFFFFNTPRIFKVYKFEKQ